VVIFKKNEIRRLREELEQKKRRLRATRRQMAEKDAEIEALRSQLDRFQNVRDALGFSNQDMPVFFLTGQAKSGTSWLMRILDSHPEVLCKGEGRFFGRDYKREDIKRIQSKIQPSSLYRAILDAEYLNAWIERSVWTRGDDKHYHLDNLTRVAINYFLTQRLSKTSKRIVGDKTPFMSKEVLDEISAIYPGARVIHIIRDGRDVAVSAMHHIWNHAKEHAGQLELKTEELAKRDTYREDPRRVLGTGEGLFTEARLHSVAESWSTQVGRAMRYGPTFLGDKYAEVRYEDLLEHPEEDVGRLLRFLGADADEKSIKRCVESASFERWSGGRKRGDEESAALLRKGVAGDWRKVFTDQDKRIYKEVAGQMLIELGYERDYDW
jgi:Sulfotransferase domain